jgi:signal transduction histidine kinase
MKRGCFLSDKPDSEHKQTLALISNLTHQAINPLNGVIGTLDNLIDGVIQGDRIKQRLNSARAQLEYTVSLIRNLSYFAQYGTESGIEPKFKSVKTCVIPQLLIEAAQFFQEQASLRGIVFEVQDRRNHIAVKGDPELLRQVFMNLYDNYAKYCHENSRVCISFWIQKKTGDVLVEYSGNSVEFSPDERIFEPGVRGKEAEKRTSSGSGLGLYICRIIIERLFKGSISAEYIRAKGLAHFTVRIPGGFQNEGR